MQGEAHQGEAHQRH